MLRLVCEQRGTTSALRRYQHPRFGLIETVTSWRNPGAHVIHIDSERDRQKWRAMGAGFVNDNPHLYARARVRASWGLRKQ